MRKANTLMLKLVKLIVRLISRKQMVWITATLIVANLMPDYFAGSERSIDKLIHDTIGQMLHASYSEVWPTI
jgi:hypothetical protein